MWITNYICFQVYSSKTHKVKCWWYCIGWNDETLNDAKGFKYHPIKQHSWSTKHSSTVLHLVLHYFGQIEWSYPLCFMKQSVFKSICACYIMLIKSQRIGFYSPQTHDGHIFNTVFPIRIFGIGATYYPDAIFVLEAQHPISAGVWMLHGWRILPPMGNTWILGWTATIKLLIRVKKGFEVEIITFQK